MSDKSNKCDCCECRGFDIKGKLLYVPALFVVVYGAQWENYATASVGVCALVCTYLLRKLIIRVKKLENQLKNSGNPFQVFY